MQRIVEPEWLDQLDPNDARALRNRRELVHLNRWLGHFRWLGRVIRQQPTDPLRIVELGAGGADWWKWMVQCNPAYADIPYTGVDMIPRPTGLPGKSEWIQKPVQQIDFSGGRDWVVANLFLHHLQDEELHSLGRKLHDSADVLIACEPFRSRLHLFLLPWVFRCLGYSPITLHDGVVSVRAGFRGNELPEKLGLQAGQWTWSVRHSLLGSYRLVARRRLT